ncbi:hypothetical protein DSCW_16750 [Desulfosarcina widdelii]|uniref:DUF599 domain-containing protein n=1 Tax=Desulfosarcina widdelii TaxID=947919 RepID=A0A5K7Z047_9BACT|nr:DUF599 domain-containing protein [Desulfosarcina widdelii]BBO74258.1 hypothetical protein DSCW_16750 [Desulfosarcina widdelii]
MNRYEAILVGISIMVVCLYHLHLYIKVKRSPETTAVGMTNLMRQQWVETIMAERRDILAVQTLRNHVMASSLLASTAILIALGIVNTVLRPAGFQEISHALNIVGTRSETLWVAKLMLLAVDFFLGFFNFTLAIRYFNHAGFGLGLPDQHVGVASHEFVVEVVNHASLHYTIGMRCYYLAIPLGLWIFGPTWMLAGALILVPVLYRLDRTV